MLQSSECFQKIIFNKIRFFCCCAFFTKHSPPVNLGEILSLLSRLGNRNLKWPSLWCIGEGRGRYWEGLGFFGHVFCTFFTLKKWMIGILNHQNRGVCLGIPIWEHYGYSYMYLSKLIARDVPIPLWDVFSETRGSLVHRWTFDWGQQQQQLQLGWNVIFLKVTSSKVGSLNWVSCSWKIYQLSPHVTWYLTLLHRGMVDFGSMVPIKLPGMEFFPGIKRLSPPFFFTT